MIQAAQGLPGEGMTLRTVSFKGAQLSAGQRRQLAFQQQIKSSFLNPILVEQMEQTLAAVDRMREQGIKGENPNKFKHESTTKGTPWVGDAFGY